MLGNYLLIILVYFINLFIFAKRKDKALLFRD